MKRTLSILLTVCLFAGLMVMSVNASEDFPYPELLLNTTTTVSTNSNGSSGELAFYPGETGWYVFEGIPNEGVMLFFSVQLHENGIVSEVSPPIAGSANTILLDGNGVAVSALTTGSRASGMKSLYLQGGKTYTVGVRALNAVSMGIVTTFPIIVRAANSITGKGNVTARNIELNGVGAIARADMIFASPPPYGVLRVSVQGDAVGQDLVAKKAGVSTFIFYDLADNEVGRSTVTVLTWWQQLPSFVQFLLRWVCFGWIWMK